MRRVLVIGTAFGGGWDKQLLELLGGGQTLAAALGGELAAAVVGGGAAGDGAAGGGDTASGGPAAEAARAVSTHGARRVYLAQHPLLEDYQADLYLAALTEICRQAEPAVILCGAGDHGRELAPRLAHRLGGSLVTDCVAIRAEGGEVCITRPVYGGKALAEVVARCGPVVATVRPRAFEAPAAGAGAGAAETVAVTLALAPALARTRIVERQVEEKAGPALEEARVIVSGGRGVGGAEEFNTLEELAAVLGAAVGASRAAVDAGWVPASRQVGQTGKIVAPDLYIAVGISGASQHMAGVSAAKHIVAVNKDPEAPIFKRAELGVVADYRQVVPALAKKLRERLVQ